VLEAGHGAPGRGLGPWLQDAHYALRLRALFLRVCHYLCSSQPTTRANNSIAHFFYDIKFFPEAQNLNCKVRHAGYGSNAPQGTHASAVTMVAPGEEGKAAARGCPNPKRSSARMCDVGKCAALAMATASPDWLTHRHLAVLAWS
jgi:hypothetical protein